MPKWLAGLCLWVAFTYSYNLQLKEKLYTSGKIKIQDIFKNGRKIASSKELFLDLSQREGWHYLTREEIKQRLKIHNAFPDSIADSIQGKGLALFVRKPSLSFHLAASSETEASKQTALFKTQPSSGYKAVIFSAQYKGTRRIPRGAKVDVYFFQNNNSLHLWGKLEKPYILGGSLKIKLSGSKDKITFDIDEKEIFYQ